MRSRLKKGMILHPRDYRLYPAEIIGFAKQHGADMVKLRSTRTGRTRLTRLTTIKSHYSLPEGA